MFSEDYISKNISRFTKKDLDDLLEKRKFSESFLQNNLQYLDKDLISLHQTLSEDFIIRNIDKVNMKIISYSQKLSEGFILDYIDRLNLEDLLEVQELSDYTRRKLRQKKFFDET